jgi:hypothetical protein
MTYLAIFDLAAMARSRKFNSGKKKKETALRKKDIPRCPCMSSWMAVPKPCYVNVALAARWNQTRTTYTGKKHLMICFAWLVYKMIMRLKVGGEGTILLRIEMKTTHLTTTGLTALSRHSPRTKHGKSPSVNGPTLFYLCLQKVEGRQNTTARCMQVTCHENFATNLQPKKCTLTKNAKWIKESKRSVGHL